MRPHTDLEGCLCPAPGRLPGGQGAPPAPGLLGLIASPGTRGLRAALPPQGAEAILAPQPRSPRTLPPTQATCRLAAPAGPSTQVGEPRGRSAPLRPGRGAPARAQLRPPGGRSAHLAAAFGSRVRLRSVSSFPRGTASLEIKSPPLGLNRRGLAPLPPTGRRRAGRPTPGR